MAGNLSLAVRIGGAVDGSLGRSLSSVGKGLDGLKAKAERARGLQSLIGETVELRRQMRQTVQEGGGGLKKLEDRHTRNIALLKQHGVAVGSLEKEYQRLGRAARSSERMESGKARIGKGIEQTKAGLQTGAAVAAGVAAPTMIAANYQAIIRDIAIKGGIARTGEEQALSDSIRRDAAANGMGSSELAEAVNSLVAGGMAVKEAGALAGTLARFSVGQNAESTDVASMVLALRQAGIADPKAIEAALGKVAVAGDLGSFEAKDMAKWFSVLMPQMTGFGMSGENATVALAGMLQTQMKAAGSADEAANNLANLLSKITSDETKTKFKNQGIDLEGSMQSAITKGYDPVAAFLGIVEQSMQKTDPAKAKKLAEIQAQIAKTEDPAKRQKMLDGYLAMAGLSEYIADMQAKQAALAAIQNKQLHQQNLKTIQSTDGVAKIEQDLASRRAASAQIWREAGNAMNDAMGQIGDAIRPVTDLVGTGIGKMAATMGAWSKEYPNWVTGIVAIGGAIATWKVAKGGLGILGGALDLTRGLLGRGGKDSAAAGERSLLGRVVDRFTGGKGGAVVDGVLGSGDVQQVFVTNWPGSGIDNLADRLGSGGRGGKPAESKPGGAMGLLGRLGGKLGGALALGTAAYQVYDTATHAGTVEEKAEGYGGAAGGLAGGLAGAKLGALVGALGGPLGVAVGGVLGSAIGSFGGDALGAWLGRTLMQPEVRSAPSADQGSGNEREGPGDTVSASLGRALDSLPAVVTGSLAPVLGGLVGNTGLGRAPVRPEERPVLGTEQGSGDAVTASLGRALEGLPAAVTGSLAPVLGGLVGNTGLGRAPVRPEERPAFGTEQGSGDAVSASLGRTLDNLPIAMSGSLAPLLGTLAGSVGLGSAVATPPGVERNVRPGRVLPRRVDPAQSVPAVEDSGRARWRRDATGEPSSGSEIDYQGLLEKLQEVVQPEEAPAPRQVPQMVSFAPVLNVVVQGDVKEPQQLATQLMPYLQRLFDEFKAKQARAELFDAAHV